MESRLNEIIIESSGLSVDELKIKKVHKFAHRRYALIFALRDLKIDSRDFISSIGLSRTSVNRAEHRIRELISINDREIIELVNNFKSVITKKIKEHGVDNSE